MRLSGLRTTNALLTTRVMVAAQGLGLSEACLTASIRYAKERTAFGSSLSSFHLTRKKLTEIAVMIEALRGLVYKSAWLIDAGRPDYHLAAMAKFLSGQTAVFCANNALEIHGGYGYIEEYPVQKCYRDAKIPEIYEDTKEAEIMTIGRALQFFNHVIPLFNRLHHRMFEFVAFLQDKGLVAYISHSSRTILSNNGW